MRTERVNYYDESSVEETSGIGDRYAVIMPYTSNLDDDGTPVLSNYSRLATRAALDLYQRFAKKLVLCGEHTFGGEEPSTSDLMRRMLEDLGVPSEDIVTVPGENLNNTPMQIQAVASEQQNGNLGKEPLIVVTWGFHEPRLRSHMRGFGLRGETVLVDDYLRSPSAGDERMDESKIQAVQRPFEIQERLLRPLSRIAPQGKLLGRITRRLGARVVDFSLTDGSVTVLATTAPKRLNTRVKN